MKTKIKIIGPRVHNVGYRPFLIALADVFGIQRFEVHNSLVEGKQVVIAKADADEDQFRALIDAMQNRKPKKAEILDICYEPFDGHVRSIVRTSMMSMNTQLAKGIDAIESINEKMDLMLDKQDKMLDKHLILLIEQEETTEAVRDLRRSDERFARMEKDIRTIKSKLSIR